MVKPAGWVSFNNDVAILKCGGLSVRPSRMSRRLISWGPDEFKFVITYFSPVLTIKCSGMWFLS